MRYILFFIFSIILISEKKPEACVSSEEEKLLTIINEFRKSEGLAPIPFSAALTKVARSHVRDLENEYDFSPDNECNPHSWSEKGDWTPCCYTNDHRERECMWKKPDEISGYTDSGYEIAFYASAGATAQEGLEAWLKSTAHRPLLENSGQWAAIRWNALGVGIYGKFAVVWFGAKPDPSEMIVCD